MRRNVSPQKPIYDPQFWADRLRTALDKGQLWHSVFVCTRDEWESSVARLAGTLQQVVKPRDSVLDVGCGYGAACDCLPAKWEGRYLGVDLSPDLIEQAKKLHPTTQFPRASFLIADAR